MTQTEIIAILKEKGYSYLAGSGASEVYGKSKSVIAEVMVTSDGQVDCFYEEIVGAPMESFSIFYPTPELLKQIL